MEDKIRHELKSITDIPGADRDKRVADMVEFVVSHVTASVSPGETPSAAAIRHLVDDGLTQHIRQEIRAHDEANDDW